MPTPDPVIGDRVVVRYRLGLGGPDDWRATPNPAVENAPTQSDVTGVLRSSDDVALVIRRGDEDVRVPRQAITSLRTLSRTVVRNSEIRAVEEALCGAADPTDRAEFDGWLLQAGGTGLRGSVAVPVGFAASSAAVGRVRAWLSSHGLPPVALLPDRLVRPGSVPVADTGYAVEVLVSDAAVDGVNVVEFTPGRWAVTVRADDPAARQTARLAGFTLHHTARVHEL